MKTFLFLLLIPIIGFSQTELPSHLSTEIERRVTENINYGVAIATINQKGIIDYYNYGLEGKGDSKITENSTFEIASLSKTFTTTVINSLAKIGALSLTQEIRNFVPAKLPEQIKKITINQLINHTSGLPKLPPNYWPSNWDNPFLDHNKKKFISSLMHTELDSTNNWNYSNMGYALLGLIADDLTKNKGIENLISQLGLKETCTKVKHQISTIPHSFGIEVENWDFPKFNRYMGGIKSSSSDLAKFLHYQIKNNAAFTSSLFSSNIVINPNDSIVNRDGWLVFYRNKQEIIWHNGISGGYYSFIGYNIQTKLGIVILSNSQSSISDIGLHYLSKAFPLNKPKPSLAIKIEQYINLEKLDTLETIWNTPDSLNFNKNPFDLYWLQNHYIAKQKYTVALLLNSLLCKDLPGDWELIYYRAKIYELMKDYTTAIELYKQANSLFPENNFILTQIKALEKRKK